MISIIKSNPSVMSGGFVLGAKSNKKETLLRVKEKREPEPQPENMKDSEVMIDLSQDGDSSRSSNRHY